VKQGPNLSIFLFNLAVDTIIRHLRKDFSEPIYTYLIEGFRKIMYAYADDLLIFSNPKDDLNKIFNVITDFINYDR
jgi:hypothetical protein